MVDAPFTDDYRFTGPNVAISCIVEYDRDGERYVAKGDHGHRGTGDTSAAAALNCFRAWMTNDLGWFEPQED